MTITTPTTGTLAALVVIATLGHVMAAFWYVAAKRRWTICSRTIYDLPVSPDQIRRELWNSLHAPSHAVWLALFVLAGFFANTSWTSFAGSVVLTTAWAEVWHYASHRAMHWKSLHWIHNEHHKSHLNTYLTAISFSFTEKLIFDAGLLGLLAVVDLVAGLNVFGIAAWYVGYLLINSYSHANFELKSPGYNRWIGQVITSTTYHSLHHSRYTGNYGLGTRVLDRLFRTEWEDYERLYTRISDEKRPLKKLSEKVPAGS
jgi:sterol desaturase/sphingolipid hydroxylase (fatty acid hydroxylase superfamily)